MSGEPRWLKVDEVIELNRRIVADTGEDHQLLDRGLLESALARPRHLLALASEEPDALEMAVSLCVGISQNHAFLQGNKRTGFAAMEIFLYHAGYELRVPDKVEIANFQIAVVAHTRTEEEFLLMLDEHLHERSFYNVATASHANDPFRSVTIDKAMVAQGGIVLNTLALGQRIYGDLSAGGISIDPNLPDPFAIRQRDDDPDDEKA